MNLFDSKDKEKGLTPEEEEYFESNNCLQENLFQKRREKAILALKRAKEKSDKSTESQVSSLETLENVKDPLDIFMEKIENELKEDASNKQETVFCQTMDTQERFDNDEDTLADITELLEKKMENQRDFIDSDDELEVDENGNLKPKKLQRKLIPTVDHSLIDYKPFHRNIYKEPPELTSLSVEARAEFRNEKKISVAGYQVPQPIHTFSQLKNIVEQRLLHNIFLEKHYEPTPIQAQLIPIILSGYDVVALAETGAGKTEGYLIPAIQHVCKVLDSWSLVKMKPKEGPISLILSPTRELAMQTFKVAKRLCMTLNLRVSCFSGGYDKTQQVKEIRAGCEICVGTPGRVIDLCTLHGSVQMSLQSVTLFILDEADRMLNLDFNEAILSIHQALRPDRQVVFVSASFPTELEKLMLRLIPKPPMRVTVGTKGKVTENVEELVEVFRTSVEKLQWIQTYWLQHLNSDYCTLVFCKSRQGAMDLCEKLEKIQIKEFVQLSKDGSHAGTYKKHMCRYLHGEMSQEEREIVLRSFREKKFSFLISTDIASRGLNLPFCDTVVNFDTAKDWETYVHRVGRAVIQDKSHVKGKAYSLLVHGNVLDKWMAGMLAESLKQKLVKPPPVLLELAMTHEPFRAAQLCGKSFFDTSAENKKGKKKASQNSFMMGIGYTPSNTSLKKASTNVPYFVREALSLTLQCAQPLKRRWDTQEDVLKKECVDHICKEYSMKTTETSVNEECVPSSTGKRLKIFSATDDISSSDDEKPLVQHTRTNGLVNTLKEQKFSSSVKNTKESVNKVSRWE